MGLEILIVEDEVIISAMMKMELEIAGYLVCGCVTTGEKALKFVQDIKPDVILMDINLAGNIDGIEAAEQIREFLNIPIIFMTGYNESGIIDRINKLSDPVTILATPVKMWDLKPVLESISG
ncbi:MAG: response regulator [Fidelibacterota bacterium]